jgi:hypothetical protein
MDHLFVEAPQHRSADPRSRLWDAVLDISGEGQMRRESSGALRFQVAGSSGTVRETKLVRYGQLPSLLEEMGAGSSLYESLIMLNIERSDWRSAWVTIARLVDIGYLKDRDHALDGDAETATTSGDS